VSVVSGRKNIFCEGKQTSLDSRLLNKVVENLLGDRPTIVATGSKFTFSIFVQGYFSRDATGNQQYIVFRDRDFDAKPTANIQLLQLGNRLGHSSVFLTYRACVENYLFDADLIHTYWVAKYAEKLENSSSRWGHGDSPGINVISGWIETAARSLQEYQAVRWALADLLQMSAAREQFKTTWTGGSGQLPSSLALQDCRVQAVELINQFTQAVATVTQDRFEESLATYQHSFVQEEFWVQQQYLIWFHGKDLQKAMQRQQSQYISLKAFFDWAIPQLDITQHSDLMELRTRIEQL